MKELLEFSTVIIGGQSNPERDEDLGIQTGEDRLVKCSIDPQYIKAYFQSYVIYKDEEYDAVQIEYNDGTYSATLLVEYEHFKTMLREYYKEEPEAV